MNALVLVRVAAALNRALSGARLREVCQDGPHRFRIGFESPETPATLIVSLRPGRPWIGRPRSPRPPGRGAGGPFAAACTRALAGLTLATVRHPGAERLVWLDFADGRALVVELPAHGANLLLLDAAGRVEAAARHPRRARDRQRPGATYRPPEIPGNLLDPLKLDASELEARVAERAGAGEPLAEVLRRRVFGLGAEGAELLLEERRGGAAIGAILVRRMEDLTADRADPVLDAPPDPLAAARSGVLPVECCRLWPWEPTTQPAAGLTRFQGRDAADTAGLYHEALELAEELTARAAGLTSLARRERRRLWDAARRAEADLAGFADPEAHRRAGEALLAGMSRAVRQGDRVRVPDPYGAEGAVLEIPVDPGQPLPAAAEACFARHRRGRRGQRSARARLDQLERQMGALDEVLARYAELAGAEAVSELEQALKGVGLPIALEPDTRVGRARRRTAPPRLEGVRVLTSRSGATILVGKGGRGNDRLTFGLAAPEDLWFHALGLPGAHVVIRDPGRKPAATLLEEAAAVAAWYSDARDQARVDVQWTRRKYVRRRRGGPPGAVLIKKFRTVRVRPGLPVDAGLAPGGPSSATERPS